MCDIRNNSTAAFLQEIVEVSGVVLAFFTICLVVILSSSLMAPLWSSFLVCWLVTDFTTGLSTSVLIKTKLSVINMDVLLLPMLLDLRE